MNWVGALLYLLKVSMVTNRVGLGLVALGVLAVPLPALGQSLIVPDETLGAESSIVTEGMEVRGALADRIDGGALRDANLFHSFLEFNVDEGQRVYFGNPADVANIFSRITGSNPSDILGTLGVDGAANLFFLNPNGIVFGENASLDIEGSFVGSAGSSFIFPDGSEFSAVTPGDSSLLTVSVPLGLQYGPNPPGATISNRGAIATGQDLTLSADVLDLEGQVFAGDDLTLRATDLLQIRDSGEAPFVAASGGEMLVQGDQTVDIFALNHPESGLFSGGDMVLRSANAVGGDAHYWSGGSFRIETLNQALGDLHSPHDPIIRVAGDLELGNYLGASLHILAGGSVTIPGFIGITGADVTGAALVESIVLSDGTPLSINGIDQPTVDIRAGVSADAIGNPLGVLGDGVIPITGTAADTATNADISIGYIGMFAPDGLVYLTNQYQPNSSLSGGTITLDGDGLFLPSGPTLGINTLTESGNGTSIILDSRSGIIIPNRIRTGSVDGNSGDITLIAAGDVSIVDNGLLNATTVEGIGDAGSVRIDAGGAVTLNGPFGSGIRSNVTSDSIGNGGVITIRANALTLSGATLIDTSTFGIGNAGKILIDVADTVALEQGSFIFNNIEEGAVGNTGGIEIRARALRLDGRPQITVGNIGGTGDLGDVYIEVTDSVSIAGTALDLGNRSLGALIGNRLELDSSGTAGDVVIKAGALSLSNGQITASTFGAGNAGDVRLSIRDGISLTNNSGIFSSVDTGGVGNGGDIQIEANSLTIDQSVIQTIVRGPAFGLPAGRGNAGDIDIALTGNLSIDGGFDPLVDEQPSIIPFGVITAIAFDVTEGATPSDRPTAGNIQITAGDLSITGGGELRSVLDRGSIGDAGNIDVTVQSLSMSNIASITSSTLGQGDAGDISLSVAEDASLTSSATIFSSVNSGAIGDGGDITLDAGSLSVIGGQVGTLVGVQLLGFNSLPPAQGNAGDIDVTVRGTAVFDGLTLQGRRSGVLSNVSADSGGSGGDIAFQSERLRLDNGARFNSETDSSGAAGDVSITAQRIGFFNGSGIQSSTTSSGAGGNIHVNTDRFVLRGGSFLVADGLEDSTGQAGNLTVNAAESIEITGASPTLSASGFYAQARSAGDAGELRVRTQRLSIADGGTISAETSGSGSGGNLRIEASDWIEIMGGAPDQSFSSSINAGVEDGASGDAGDIQITTGRLLAQDGGFVASSAGQNSTGSAGSIRISATDLVELIGETPDDGRPSGVSVATELGAAGNTGNLTINTERLVVADGAGILAQNFGLGQAGTIRVDATASIDVIGSKTDPSLINASVGPTATGTTGNIRVDTAQLRLLNGGQIIAGTFGRVNAGDIRVRATDGIAISGATPDGLFASGIVATSSPVILGEAGQGGNIDVHTQTLTLDSGGQISASTFGRASAGNITIRAEDVSLDGGTISTTIEQSAVATTPSRISINARSLQLHDGASITSSSQGQGDAGDLFITVADTLTVEDSDITTQAESSAGGSIDIRASDIRLFGDGDIQTSVQRGTEGGGDIVLTADTILAFDDSDILAFAQDGAGGNISLETPAFFGEDFDISTIDIASDGLDGNDRVDVNASGAVAGVVALPDISFIQNSLANLPEGVINTESLIANSCVVQSEDGSTFTITGAGGLPEQPGDTTTGYPTGSVQPLPEDQSWQPGDPIVEPQGVYQLPNGELVLSHACQ